MPSSPRSEVAAVEGASRVHALACHDGTPREVDDWVADEAPVALQYNGISHAVMLATPLDLEDFAWGFSLAEGLIDGPDDLRGIDVEATPDGWVLDIEIATRCEVRLKERKRSMAGRTGCGLCGIDSLEQAVPPLNPLTSSLQVPARAVAAAMRSLRATQPLQAATGGTHAAAWCDTQGEIRLVREDVGRHNALDKLVGALARRQLAAASGFVAVTSRASFEMVHKCVRAGVPLMAAISAPTHLAIRTAEAAGFCLLGFARGDDWVAYAHPHRLNPSC